MANEPDWTSHLTTWKSKDARDDVCFSSYSEDRAFNSNYCHIVSSSNYYTKDTSLDGRTKVFKCSLCDYSARCTSHIQSHVNSQHIGLKPFKCSYCSFRTAHKQSLDTHLKRHTGIRPYKCQFCLWSATESGQLRIHQRKHTGEKPFQCSMCPFKAASKSAISEHQRIHSSDSLVFKCVICEFSTRTRAKLQNHMKIHELKYCTKCPYSTRESSEFRKHSKSHKLKCKYCLKMLKDITKLKEHESTHTGDRKWKCHLCSYNSSKKILLDKHLQSHHPEGNTSESDPNLLKCNLCSFTSKRPSSMGVHTKSHVIQ